MSYIHLSDEGPKEEEEEEEEEEEDLEYEDDASWTKGYSRPTAALRLLRILLGLLAVFVCRFGAARQL